MRVVTEVAVVGLAQLFETARTGIYRVISSLTPELLSRNEADISFVSLSSLQVNRLAHRYFADLGFAHRMFPQSLPERIVAGMVSLDDAQVQKGLTTRICSRLYRMSRVHRIGRQADIFHSQYGPLPRFPGSRRPVRMLTIYDIIPLLHPEYFADGFAEEFRPIVESFSPERDYIFTISRCSRDDICEYFHMDPLRVFVVSPAADSALYSPVRDQALLAQVRRRYAIPEGRYFLTLATVEKRKNLATSLQAFSRVIREPGYGDLCFVLVGTRGWKVADLLLEIERDPLLRDRVIFTGFVPDKDLSALYSAAEAFLYPSLYEGFGLPPLEAMQCGLPVISSTTSSLPEVVGDAGILVDPLDVDALCQAMVNLLEDGRLRERLAARGLQRAGEFSWGQCARQTMAGYAAAWDGRS